MPEGDTIHVLARTLGTELCGRRLEEARLEHQPVRSLVGAEVDEVFAVGKHLFVAAGAAAVRTHLGMEGSWHRYRPGERWQKPSWSASCVLRTAERLHVCFRAQEVELVDLRGQRHRAFLRRLGPDLLAEGFDPARAVERARALLPAEAALADVLLDQRVAAGVGNVYKNELLFLAGLDPATPQARLDDGALAELFTDARAALRRNLGPGPRRTRGRRAAPGKAPDSADEPGLWVYHRGNEPCLVCGTRIRFARTGRHHRSTWWCPRCQKSTDRAEST